MSQQLSANFMIQFVIGLLILGAGAALIYFFASLAATVALSVIAYLIIDSPVKRLEHYRISRAQSLIIVILVFMIASLVFVLFLGPKIYTDLNAITAGIPTIQERFSEVVATMEQTVPNASLYLTAQRIENVQNYFLSILSTIISLMRTWVVNIVLVIPLLTILLLTTGNGLKKAFLQFVPNSYFEMTVTIIDQIITTSREYIFAKFLESLVIAIICVIGFWIIGLPGAIILGVLVGLLNLIPYFGPLLSTIPPLIMAIVSNDVTLGISAVVIIGISQIVDNVYLQPVLVSKIVKIHPLLVVLVTFMGAELLGPLGMVIAIPVFTIGKILVYNLYQFLRSLQRRSLLRPALEQAGESRGVNSTNPIF